MIFYNFLFYKGVELGIKTRKLTRKSLDELAKVMPVLSECQQNSYVGGGLFHDLWNATPDGTNATYTNTGSGSFSGSYGEFEYDSGYVSGNTSPYSSGESGNEDEGCKSSCVFNVFDYLDEDKHNACYYYYQTKNNLGYEPKDNGAFKTEDIPAIGAYGGFKVTKMSTDFNITSNGLTDNGEKLIMSFDMDGTDHLVIVTGRVKDQNGNITIFYHDPTNGLSDIIDIKQCGGFFSVK